MTDKRFTTIEPLLVEPIYGAEPPLFNILINYYATVGHFTLNEAKELAREYIAEWVKQETLLNNQSRRLRDESNNH